MKEQTSWLHLWTNVDNKDYFARLSLKSNPKVKVTRHSHKLKKNEEEIKMYSMFLDQSNELVLKAAMAL